ncbi:MAG: hypothetical protein RJA44_1120 [Pseudomonadota bacterium]|jgi:acetyl esterase
MLDPQARALIELMAERAVPPIHSLSPAEARHYYRERRYYTQPAVPEVAEVRELQAPGPRGLIPLRLYWPLGEMAAAMLPALVYFHGGGWTIGDLDTHDVLCRQLANASGCVLISVDYALAPEYGFPCAPEDCLTATRWIQQQAAALGIDPMNMGIGGDSAGGNLAAVVAIMARDAGDLPLALQLLIYPATDMRAVAPSHTSNGEGYLLTRESVHYYRGHYLPERRLDLDWRASPLLCRDLSGLPPALVITAGFDPLRDEGLQYADRLSAAGNICQYICFERQIHGFITMGRVIDEANTAVGLCALTLRRALRGG